jgi:thiol:disulfide interchange protein DsbD
MNLRSGARSLVELMVAACAACALSAAAADDLLAPEQAFRFSARLVDPGLVEVRYRIAEGYYMYRDKFRFTAIPQSAGLGEARFPPVKVKDDEFFGRVETYRGDLLIKLPVKSAGGFTLKAVSQGCADVGVCYIPVTQTVRLVAARSSDAAPESGANTPDLLMRLREVPPSR